jgi:hypothetical protein
MADTSRTLKVIFEGSVSGLRAAAAQARAAISSVNGSLDKHRATALAASKVAAEFAAKVAAMGLAATAAQAAVVPLVSTIGGLAA